MVYDPQQDLVSWPHGWRPRDRTGGEEVTDELEFTWYVVPDTTAPDVPRRLVQSLRDHAPEALPKRYGGCEPLAHRFNDDAAFVEQWLLETTQGFGALFWTATPPSFGGSMFADRTARCLRMGLSFDARPFYRDRAVTRRIVALFHSLAADLGCVYGAATVQRGVVIRRGRASSRFGKETGPLPRTTGWVGLPAAPTWIAWFGRPYAERVRASVAGHIAAASEVGILVQAGEDPMTADRLADVFPPLPAPLLARRGRRARWERGATFTWGFAPPSDPAQEIPPLD